jgi:hypothetical protein
MDKKNETFIKFMQILNDITREVAMESEEDKTRSYWEKAFIDSWERLIDKDENRNHEFFVLRENLLSELERSSLEEAKQEDHVPALLKKEVSAGTLKRELQNNYQDNLFI